MLESRVVGVEARRGLEHRRHGDDRRQPQREAGERPHLLRADHRRGDDEEEQVGDQQDELLHAQAELGEVRERRRVQQHARHRDHEEDRGRRVDAPEAQPRPDRLAAHRQRREPQARRSPRSPGRSSLASIGSAIGSEIALNGSIHSIVTNAGDRPREQPPRVRPGAAVRRDRRRPGGRGDDRRPEDEAGGAHRREEAALTGFSGAGLPNSSSPSRSRSRSSACTARHRGPPPRRRTRARRARGDAGGSP